MRCCGTLEFLCDFYEQCHETQRVLQEKNAELKELNKIANEEEDLTKENGKNSEDDESDKENVIPPIISPDNSRRKSLDSDVSNTLTSSSPNKSNNKIPIDDNPLENLPLEPAPQRSHDNVLADITDQHCEHPKTAISQELFPIATKGVKRTRKSPLPVIARKTRRVKQKKITDSFKVKVPNGNAQNSAEENEVNEQQHPIKSQEVPVIVKHKKELKESNRNEESPEDSNQNTKQFAGTESLIALPEKPKSEKNNKCDESRPETGDEAEEESFTLNLSVSSSSPSVPISTANKDRKSVIESPSNPVEDKNDNEDDPKSSITKKRKGITYGKISDLMSQEQKEAIEKYYTLDMSVVNESVVKKNYYINEKKQIICKVCNAIYPRVDKCHVHIWGHLDMKPYRCNACDFATVTVTNIRCHIRKSHLKIKPFECHICNKRFVTAVLLEEHINTHTGARPYQCKICSFSSASRQVLTYHNTTHKTVKDITCDICKKQFYSKGRMRAHMITHNKDKTLMCKYCSHHFTTSEALQRHYENIHSKDYVCNTCGKRTKSRKALHNHQNVHLEAKYKCPICPNVYKSSHILKEHLLKHEGIRKYKCDVCNKDFAQQSHLAAHKAVHSEKRYFCPGCRRAFNRHDNMKMHTKRCEPFLANPELKSLLSRRPSSRATSDGDPDDINDSNDGFDNKSNKTEDFNETSEDGSFRIGEVDIVPISNVQVPVNIATHTKVTVTESVIGLECF